MITLYVFEFCEMNAYNRVPQEYYLTAAPAIAISLLVVPLFDTLRVIATRIKKGTSPFSPDKNHIHHLLLKTGLKHRYVTYVLISITILFFLIGILAKNWSNGSLVLLVFILACILTYMLWRIVDLKNKKNKK